MWPKFYTIDVKTSMPHAFSENLLPDNTFESFGAVLALFFEWPSFSLQIHALSQHVCTHFQKELVSR